MPKLRNSSMPMLTAMKTYGQYRTTYIYQKYFGEFIFMCDLISTGN